MGSVLVVVGSGAVWGRRCAGAADVTSGAAAVARELLNGRALCGPHVSPHPSPTHVCPLAAHTLTLL